MADNISEIRKFFRDNDVPLGQDDVWEVQKVAVVKHKALERLAAKLAIRWQRPDILRCESDEAAILVIGSLGEHVEWSIGEARIVPMVDSGRVNKWGKPVYEPAQGAIGNYQITPKQASYMWAMAEKRGKDRVILKLAGIDAFSEEESDDFTAKQSRAPAHEPPADEPDITELLASAEKSLQAAAMLGGPSLIKAWQSLPPATREGFGEGGRCPARFKAIAAEHDKPREAA